MRKIFVLFSLVAALLCGCNAQTDRMQQALDFRAAVLESGCGFKARVTADYGDRVFSFTLACTYSPESGGELTVLEPQTLAGIRAVCTAREARVEYDGLTFGLGDLGGGRLAPMQLPLILGQCWCGEYIAAAGEAENGWRMSCDMGYENDALRVDTWFSEGGAPEYCEISADGELLLSAQLYEFQLN